MLHIIDPYCQEMLPLLPLTQSPLLMVQAFNVTFIFTQGMGGGGVGEDPQICDSPPYTPPSDR